MTTIKRESYVTIQGWMITDLGLQGKDLMVYAIIYGYSQNEMGKFTGSQQYLADWVGCTRRTINDVLKGLVDRKLVIKQTYDKNGMCMCEYTADVTRYNKIIDDNFIPYEKISHPPVKNLHTPSEEISHNNIEDNIEDNSSNPPIIPKKKKNSKKNGCLSIETIMEEIDKRNFSDAVHTKLAQWVLYKEERSQYKTITGLNMQLSQLENVIKKRGEKAVLMRMDEAMSREWVGWNFDTIDAFNNDRPFVKVQQLDKKPKYKNLDNSNSASDEDRKNFQELAKGIREKLKDMKD